MTARVDAGFKPIVLPPEIVAAIDAGSRAIVAYWLSLSDAERARALADLADPAPVEGRAA